MKIGELLSLNDDTLKSLANQVYISQQTVLEFMDKGIKGLLTGDLSVYLIQQIQTSIDKYQERFSFLTNEIQSVLQQKQTVDEFMNENFQIGIDGTYHINNPTYETVQNFEQNLIAADMRSVKQNVLLKQNINYQTPHSLINSDLLKTAKVVTKTQLNFSD